MIAPRMTLVTIVLAGLATGVSACHCCPTRVPAFAPPAPCPQDCRRVYSAAPTFRQEPFSDQPFVRPAAPPPVTSQRPPEIQPATGPWQPTPGLRPHVTETRPLPAPENRAKLLPPEAPDGARLKPPVTEERQQKPPVTEERQPSPQKLDPVPEPDPSDIPGFQSVYAKVTAGSQPFPSGFDWLKRQGYRTVLNVRAAGEDESAARTNAETSGLKYLSIEVSPRDLDRQDVANFSRIIRDAAGHPLFVYDRKGMSAGALWYLHFRLTENLPDTEARSKAMTLGLKEETAEEYSDLWLAIQRLLKGS